MQFFFFSTASCQVEVIAAVVRRSEVKDESAAWFLPLITFTNLAPDASPLFLD